MYVDALGVLFTGQGRVPVLEEVTGVGARNVVYMKLIQIDFSAKTCL